MYNPRMFAETDRTILHEFMQAHPFVTLLSVTDQSGVAVTHLPVAVTLDQDGAFWITGHVARANAHWRLFDGRRGATMVFHGPHAYVSPAWYATPDVPTWDYAVVHAHGAPAVLEDPDKLRQGLRDLIAPFETAPHAVSPAHVVEQFEDKLKRIVGLEMRVDRIEGKFKLDQDRPISDQHNVARALLASSRCSDRECGELIASRLRRSTPSPAPMA